MGPCLGKKRKSKDTTGSIDQRKKSSQQSTLSNHEISTIKEKTKMTRQTINEFHEMFIETYPLGYVTMDEFRQEFESRFPEGDVETLSKLMFHAYDTGETGTIDYQEYVIALTMTTEGDLDDKLEWTFTLMDKDKDGFITKDEMLFVYKAFQNCSKHEEFVPENNVDDFFKKLGTDKIDLATFTEYAREDPIFLREIEPLINFKSDHI